VTFSSLTTKLSKSHVGVPPSGGLVISSSLGRGRVRVCSHSSFLPRAFLPILYVSLQMAVGTCKPRQPDFPKLFSPPAGLQRCKRDSTDFSPARGGDTKAQAAGLGKWANHLESPEGGAVIDPPRAVDHSNHRAARQSAPPTRLTAPLRGFVAFHGLGGFGAGASAVGNSKVRSGASAEVAPRP
jgi:hypothetical protein